MREIEKGKTRKTSRIVAGIFLLCLAPMLSAATEEDVKVKIRETIIDLVEEELSEAYSFTEASTHPVPHFEVLDRIYPKWHHGDPASARQFWVNAKYRSFLVYYRVDYVYVINELSARAEGKRLIIWNQQEGGPDFSTYWPFQLWASLPKRTHRDNTYLSAMYPMRYKMKLTVNETGEWYVSEERLRDNPEMSNNLQNHCLYEKQLEDWGLKNDCNKKLLPQ